MIERECPYCKSHRIESMGFRDEDKTVRRFRCNDCHKSHSRDANTFEIRTDEPIKSRLHTIKVTATLNVTPYTKERLLNLKIIDRETIDDVISRLIDEHYNKQKKV